MPRGHAAYKTTHTVHSHWVKKIHVYICVNAYMHRRSGRINIAILDSW